jgi:hypothetical protein
LNTLSSIFIDFKNPDGLSSFTATWKRVPSKFIVFVFVTNLPIPVVCCENVKIVSTGGAEASYGTSYLAASWAHNGDINGSPIYKDGDKWMAVKTVTAPQHGPAPYTAWIVSSTTFGVEPGSNSGIMFGK